MEREVKDGRINALHCSKMEFLAYKVFLPPFFFLLSTYIPNLRFLVFLFSSLSLFPSSPRYLAISCHISMSYSEASGKGNFVSARLIINLQLSSLVVFLSQNPVSQANVKLALFYDWLFFLGEKDNIMNIGKILLIYCALINFHEKDNIMNIGKILLIYCALINFHISYFV